MRISDARYKVEELLTAHGLVKWSFALGRGKTTLGSCCHIKREIKLSRYLVELGTDAEIMDTIRHEIAHALLEPRHGHDYTWQLKAIELGAKPRACVAQSWNVPHKWEIWCGHWGKAIDKRYNRPNRARLTRQGCRKCGKLLSVGRLYVQRAIQEIPV